MSRTCDVDGCEGIHQAQGLCRKHYNRLQRNGGPLVLKTLPSEQRFWAKVDKYCPATESVAERGLGACWLWVGSLKGKRYASITIGGKSRQAHRYAYELLVGPIPEGLDLDHLCRVRHCVNPAHLEPVTHHVNVLRGEGRMAKQARQTHCKNGHEFTAENTILRDGRRRCKTCDLAYRKAAYQRRKAAKENEKS